MKDLADKASIPLFTCHAFRLTHASLLLNAGRGNKEISHRLSHSNISITLDTYAHLSENRDKETADIFNQVIANF